MYLRYSRFIFFKDTATTEIYTLSLHDALPISRNQLAPLFRHGIQALPHYLRQLRRQIRLRQKRRVPIGHFAPERFGADRKSTRLNSSHSQISYAVFCLKKKNRTTNCSTTTRPS